MKAMIETNRTGRILTTVMILTMAAAVGYGQGLLAEGAMKLINSLTNKHTAEQSIFHQAGYTSQANTAVDREFSPAVVRSFSVEDVDITFEKQVNTETWMTESFAENVEEGVTVEAWMTSPIAESLETPLDVEAWMTTPMTENLEAAVTVEGWMTTPLNTNPEGSISAEAWMTTPLYASIETAPEVESWMTAPFLENGVSEESVQLEEWMTESLR